MVTGFFSGPTLARRGATAGGCGNGAYLRSQTSWLSLIRAGRFRAGACARSRSQGARSHSINKLPDRVHVSGGSRRAPFRRSSTPRIDRVNPRPLLERTPIPPLQLRSSPRHGRARRGRACWQSILRGLFQNLSGLRRFWRQNPSARHEMRVELREIQLARN